MDPEGYRGLAMLYDAEVIQPVPLDCDLAQFERAAAEEQLGDEIECSDFNATDVAVDGLAALAAIEEENRQAKLTAEELALVEAYVDRVPVTQQYPQLGVGVVLATPESHQRNLRLSIPLLAEFQI